MRLLVATQAVDLDDPVLGFFHRWLELLASRTETLEVICLREGRHTLPSNVRVYSLGASSPHGQATRDRRALRHVRDRIRYAARFLLYTWRLRRAYDAVFIHMNPEYVVLAGWWWRLCGTRIVLWYTHRSVNLRLRMALVFANAVATAAPESLRLASPKVHVVGQGIDTALFATTRDGTIHDPVALVSVGRITPIKRLETLLEALGSVTARGINAAVTFIGAPVYESDRAYETRLTNVVRELGVTERVHFAGALPYRKMPAIYRASDISINLAPTGGIDKAVLESMAAGCVILVANRAFEPSLGPDAQALMFDGAADLAEKLAALIALTPPEREALSIRLARSVRERADLAVVLGRLMPLFG